MKKKHQNQYKACTYKRNTKATIKQYPVQGAGGKHPRANPKVCFYSHIVNSFKFGTDDEIGMNLNHVKHFELDSEIQMMSPHLGKLLESDRTDTLIKTTLQTVVKLKLKEHAPLFVKHIQSKNKVLVKEAIISLQEFEYA